MKLSTVEIWLDAYDKVSPSENPNSSNYFFNSKLPSSLITRACLFEKLKKLEVRPGLEPRSPAIIHDSRKNKETSKMEAKGTRMRQKLINVISARIFEMELEIQHNIAKCQNVC